MSDPTLDVLLGSLICFTTALAAAGLIWLLGWITRE
jgi:hypothetical protein